MRFQFLKPRKDVATAEQVRALRERRGWTAEELADAVHASAVEVSAWEAGAVRVPAEQALLIRWLADVDAWKAVLDAVRGESCAWVPDHAPDLYERMFRNAAGPWLAESEAVRVHIAGCGACQAAWIQARQVGGFPPRPQNTFRARYWRWVDRLPGWVQPPFAMGGLIVEVALAGSLMFLWPQMGLAMVLGFAAFAATATAVDRVTRRPVAAVLPGWAAGAAGLLGWSIFAGTDLTEPRSWALAAAVGTVIGLGWFRITRAHARREAQAFGGRLPPRPALPPAPLDLAADLERRDPALYTLTDARRSHHELPFAAADPGVHDRGYPGD